MARIAFGILVILCVFGCKEKTEVETPETVASTKPNFLWLVVEDQSADFFPMYQDSTIDLPNLQALAKESTIYDNAFSVVPESAPTRSAIMTGMYPTTIGTHNARNYRPTSDVNEPSLGLPNYSPVMPQGVKCFTEYLRLAGYYCTNNGNEDYNFKVPESVWNINTKRARWRPVTDDSGPFFSVINLDSTHESMIWKNVDTEMLVDPASVKVPPILPDNESTRHDMAVNYGNLKKMDDQVGKVIDQLKKDGLYDNTIIFFYSVNGGPFPRYKRSLHDTGTRVPLMIKLQKGSSFEPRNTDLISLLDLAPTVLSLADLQSQHDMHGKAFLGKFVSSVKREYVITTSDRFDEEHDRVRAVRSSKYKYIRNYFPEKPEALPIAYRDSMGMMKEWKKMATAGNLSEQSAVFVAKSRPSEELYDVEADPFEMNNLATDDKFMEVQKEFQKVMEEWLVATQDLGGSSEKELAIKWSAFNKQQLIIEYRYDKGVIFNTDQIDATVLYKISGEREWKFYTGTIPSPVVVTGKSCLIGYESSRELTCAFDNR